MKVFSQTLALQMPETALKEDLLRKKQTIYQQAVISMDPLKLDKVVTTPK
jgi:hypothetical protein